MVEYFEDKLNHNKYKALENAWQNCEYQFKKLLTKNKDLFHTKHNQENNNNNKMKKMLIIL